MSVTQPAVRRDNRLARETSPYLLQHKTNPVDWWPWGPEALAEAKRTGKPILLSIGYAACHWCHVMAHESFEDPEVAAVMNELFLNIKVDREERPDVDQIYMTALHHLGEQGGWPLTMFLTSTGEPVWGGTYFPKTPHYGRPGFITVMKEIAQVFRDQPERIHHNRTALMTALTASAAPATQAAAGVSVGADQLDAAAAAIGRAFDHTNGGLGRAPKFPQCAMLEMLWRAGQRRRDPQFFDLVDLTLEHICEGGIYDHLGGGFSRYAVDDKWLVPHFEKMLYDNAQLLELLALAFQRSRKTLFLQRARETVGWLLREMIAPGGGFCASLDADSEGHEGKFYVWTREEIDAVLGRDDGAYFAGCYDVSAGGNFEGKNILNRLATLDRGATTGAASRDPAAEESRLAALRDKLLQARARRIRPGLDDKVLADWNGLMIAALANAGAALRQPTWLAAGAQAFAFVEQHMTRDDRFGHSWRDGKLVYPGLATDHTAMIKAALALHEATGTAHYLARAVQWQRALDRHYLRPDGGYYLTADDAEGLIVRPAATIDEATPNANGVAAQNLVRLALLTGDDHWRRRSDGLFDGLLPAAAQSLYLHTSLANALDLRLRAIEVVAIGPRAEQFAAQALELPFTDRVIMRTARPDDLPSGHPARSLPWSDGQSVALVCAGQRCSPPVTDPAQLATALAAIT